MSELTFKEYQELTSAFVKRDDRLFLFLMGLSGETGEVSEKFKKLYRDNDGVMTDEFKLEVTKELGDVLWYVRAIAEELGVPLEDVAKANINKIESRRARNVQHGNGDNR